MPKARAPFQKQATSPAGAAPPAPAAPALPAFNRRILPKPVQAAIKEAGIADADIPIFWAAYERGREDERQGRLLEIGDALGRLERGGIRGPQAIIDPFFPPNGHTNGHSRPDHRPDADSLPPRPDFDAMERAKAEGAPGGAELRIVERRPPQGPSASGEMPIGRYPADLVAELVAWGQNQSTDPALAREIVREYLAECEPRCASPPTSSGRTIIGRLRKMKILRASDTTQMGRAEDIDEGEAAAAAQAFGLAGGEGGDDE